LRPCREVKKLEINWAAQGIEAGGEFHQDQRPASGSTKLAGYAEIYDEIVADGQRSERRHHMFEPEFNLFGAEIDNLGDRQRLVDDYAEGRPIEIAIGPPTDRVPDLD